MKRSSRDAMLMLAPVVLLGAFGWFLSVHKPAAVEPADSATAVPKRTIPFQPFIRRVQVLPARPVDVFDGYDTRVVVEFDARGTVPLWWTDKDYLHNIVSYSENGGQLSRLRADQSTILLPQTGYYVSPYIDDKSKRWTTTYNLKLRDVPAQNDQIRLSDTIRFADTNGQILAQLPLDTPVRAPAQSTVIPKVSQAPCVTIEKISIDPSPPTMWHDGVARWRVRWVLLENIPRAGAEKNASGASTNLRVFNARKQQIGGVQGHSSGPRDDFLITGRQNRDPRRYFISEDYNLNALYVGRNTPRIGLNEPLCIQGEIRSGDKWPVRVKIPIRDATGKTLLTPRTESIPFQIVSATKVAPTPDEIQRYGTDCVVRVVLNARNPNADVSKWEWEANYSQHLRSASAGDIWKLPLKTGSQPSPPICMHGQTKGSCEIRYQITLKTIPADAGKLVFHADLAANRSRRVPIDVTVRP